MLAAFPRHNRRFCDGHHSRRRGSACCLGRRGDPTAQRAEDDIRLYFHLLGYVRSAKVDEAVEQFEQRFGPMLDQRLPKEADPPPDAQ